MDKSTGSKPDPEGNPQREGLRKGAVLQLCGPEQSSKGLGVAKRYCSIDSIGDRF